MPSTSAASKKLLMIGFPADTQKCVFTKKNISAFHCSLVDTCRRWCGWSKFHSLDITLKIWSVDAREVTEPLLSVISPQEIKWTWREIEGWRQFVLSSARAAIINSHFKVFTATTAVSWTLFNWRWWVRLNSSNFKHPITIYVSL